MPKSSAKGRLGIERNLLLCLAWVSISGRTQAEYTAAFCSLNLGHSEI